MTEASLLKRLQSGQDASTVFFPDATDHPTCARAVCALLNSDSGGTIFLGVGPKGGLKPLALTAANIQALETELKGMVSPLSLYSVAAEQVEGGVVVAIEVPAGSDRPYVVDNQIWVRDGSETRSATPDDIRLMVKAGPQAERWERRISRAMEEEDLDIGLVRNLRESAKKAGHLTIADAETEIDFLRELAYCRASGFTQAGDVVFSRNPARRHPQVRVQLLRFLAEKTDDQYENYQWFDGSALTVARQVHTALQAYNETKLVFRRGSMEREERRRYDDYTLREGIVNALAHRSYESYSGGVKVSVYPDRIEFWNSGRLPDEIKIRDLPKKHQSYPVNPDIAHAFYLDGLMEKIGRGTERIAEACKRIGAPPPVWAEEGGGVLLKLPAAVGAEEVRASQLNDRQNAFLEAVPAGETVTMAEYLARFAKDINRRQAARDLTQLESFRLVRKEGAGPSTVYRRLES